MTIINKSAPVLVTGATGYVAGWLVKKLLEQGLTVHAAVRNPNDKEKLKYLNQIAEQSDGSIKYFKTDLLKKGSFAEAIKGCELVFHTASPFTTSVKDAQKDLVDPAKLGTRNVLEEASKAKTVKRVVLTSSVAAIYGDNIDLTLIANKTVTEENWNSTSSLTHQPYSYSKTMAELEAWKIEKSQSQWDLVVINPSLVLGPAINPNAVTSESFNIVKSFGNGDMKMGVPKIGMGVVDVREVAEAHYQAGFKPEAQGRHIVSGHNSWFLEMSQTLLKKYGDRYPIPKKEMPGWILRLVGPFVNKAITRTFLKNNLGFPFTADNSKSKKELGIEYRALSESMNEMFEQMIQAGIFKK